MSHRAAGAALAILLALGPGQAGPASAADPFYENLMETGISAHARGDHHTAASYLRVASFGLLDEPVKLAECLTYLAMAQGEIDDDDGFTRTIDRLLEVERRFQAFSELTLDAGRQQALEGHLLTWIPSDVLDRSVVFRDVGRRKRQMEIQEMPSAERRAELERWLAAEPDFVPWRLMLAELDFAEGRFEAVLSAAETVLRQAPEASRARCLRGRAGAALGLCEQAVLDLEACDAPLDNGLLEQRLRCHLALGDFDAATSVLAQVSAEDRQRQPFRQLARSLERGREAAARASAASQKAAAETAPAIIDGGEPPVIAAQPTSEPPAPEPTPAPEPAESAAAPVTPPEASAVATPPEPVPPPATSNRIRAELQRLEALVTTRSRPELEAGFAAARALADSQPKLTEPQHLAAVIAYRLSRWDDVVTYTRRAGEPEAPDRQFYFSVALYEAGDRATAKEVLERCLPSLEPTEFVQGYADKILNGG